MNLILVRLGYPPAIVFKQERARYLTAMQKADNGEYGAMGELLARVITDNLHRFVVPVARLRAQKQPDGTWMSSRNWVDEYVENRYRRT